MSWLTLLIVSCLIFFLVGWPAGSLARGPSTRSGLAWFGVTFLVPGALWVVLGILKPNPPDSDYGALPVMIGWAASAAAVVVGTLIARATRRYLKGY